MRLMCISMLSLLSCMASIAMDSHGNHRKTVRNFGFEFANLGSFEDELIRFLVQRDETQRSVVEFGGGFGRLALKVSRTVAGVKYSCTDLSSEQITELKEKATTAQLARGANLDVAVCDCSKDIDFEDASKDAVVIANVLHFLPPTQALKVIANAERVLKPGGQLFIMMQTPHFIYKELADEVATKRAELASRRKLRNEKITNLEKMDFLRGLAEAQKLDEEIENIEAEEKENTYKSNQVFWPGCYSAVYRIYKENALPFPGYLEKKFLTGLYCFPSGNQTPHSVMVQEQGMHLTAEDLAELVHPFGFQTVSQKEYKITESGADERPRGHELGMVFVKNGERNKTTIKTLEEKAERAYSAREDFHKNRAVIYHEDYPYFKLETADSCQSLKCEKRGEKFCSRCKASRYCSVECQKQDWPRHKVKCSSKK